MMMIERPKLTKATYQALKRYILLEREKKKQEQEQDKAQERLRKERELRKRKEEEDSLTLEQTKEQLLQLERRLAELKQDKHGLFSELKKVLHQENEMRQRAQMKEQNEIAALQQQQQQQYPAGLQPVPGSHTSVFMQSHMVPARTKYMNVATAHPSAGVQQGIKRSRSPSSPPPQSAHYPGHYGGQYGPPGSYGGSGGGGLPGSIKQEPYSATSEYGKIPKTETSSYPSPYGQAPAARHSGYMPSPNQPPSSGGPVQGKYAPSTAPPPPQQSAFSSYPQLPAGYSYQQQQGQLQPGGSKGGPSQAPADQYPPVGYGRQPPMPRHPGSQSGYMSPHHSAAGPAGVPPLQQQLEHASQKAGFVDDKLKSHQQVQAMMNASIAQQQQQQQSMLSSNPGSQPPPRGMVYPIRPPPQQQGAATTAYGSSVSSGNMVPPRHGQSRY